MGEAGGEKAGGLAGLGELRSSRQGGLREGRIALIPGGFGPPTDSGFASCPLLTGSSTMSSDSSKKRKPKVIRTDGGPQEGKRGKADADQVGHLAAHMHRQSQHAVAGCLYPALQRAVLTPTLLLALISPLGSSETIPLEPSQLPMPLKLPL